MSVKHVGGSDQVSSDYVYMGLELRRKIKVETENWMHLYDSWSP